ncbi:hypothetical protein HUG17_6207 [Dermatophagoides farinae]|uniref:Serine/threonine-protein phosphatase n=1 Tax=Dermatophagoides farinae TaxID=6954 RepID=A0A9D4P322_DERFA|nr:hypothetical protein HUG17_6207 [Dermatophagoides farinae]
MSKHPMRHGQKSLSPSSTTATSKTPTSPIKMKQNSSSKKSIDSIGKTKSKKKKLRIKNDVNAAAANNVDDEPKTTSNLIIQKVDSSLGLGHNNNNNNNSPLRSKSITSISSTSSKQQQKQQIGRFVTPTMTTAAIMNDHHHHQMATKASSLMKDNKNKQNNGEHINHYGLYLYDCCIVYLYCRQHQRLAIVEVQDRGLFIPFTPIRRQESWQSAAERLVQNLIRLSKYNNNNNKNQNQHITQSMYNEPILMDILRIQIPDYLEFITRIVYRIELKCTDSMNICGQDINSNKTIAWYTINDVRHHSDGHDYLGAEPMILITDNDNDDHNKLNYRESTIMTMLSNVFQLSKNSNRLLQQMNYNETDILRLYSDFLQHCYPSEFMTSLSLKNFLKKWQYELPTKIIESSSSGGSGSKILNDLDRNYVEKFRQLFSQENQQQQQQQRTKSNDSNSKWLYLNFNEFILGLASIDKLLKSTKSAETNKISNDNNNNNNDNSDGNKKSRRHIDTNKNNDDIIVTKSQQQQSPLDHLRRRQHDCYPQIRRQRIRQLSLSTTMTSSISISSLSCPSSLSSLHLSSSSSLLSLKSLRSNDNVKQDMMMLAKSQKQRYTLSVHMVKMTIDGWFYEPMINNYQDVKRMPRIRRHLSKQNFNPTFICNRMIDAIRLFAYRNGIVYTGINENDESVDNKHHHHHIHRQQQQRNQKEIENSKSSSGNFNSLIWQPNSRDCIELIIQICHKMIDLFKRENNQAIINVSTPCYVIGDLHGNLHDLLVYDHTIINHRGYESYLSTANYLFLGDYVDRGDYSIECILYLFCQKILTPHRIHMLRGNHECRSLQKEFTFFDECKIKFGDKYAEKLWNLMNNVFDVMPLVAIIDDSIFCAHGGIPSCVEKLEQIAAIKLPMKEPEQESNIAHEILWNDPVSDQEYRDLLQNTRSMTTMMAVLNYNNPNGINDNLNDGKQQHRTTTTDKDSLETSSAIKINKNKMNTEHHHDNKDVKCKQQQPNPLHIRLKSGFLPNTKRGTACYYSEQALTKFLDDNHLSHLIRAHEVIPPGYQYHMGGRCLTIFSCSNYCGGINEAAGKV